MEVLAVAALALGLGLLVGQIVGAVRARRLEAQVRSVANASAGFATIGLDAVMRRPVEAILSGHVRVFLAAVPYELPVLPRIENKRWLAGLDRRFADLADKLDEAADDKGRILELLSAHTDWLLEAIRSYDVTGILPDAEYLNEYATDPEILRAAVEVWRAANPLAVILAAGADGVTDTTQSDWWSSFSTPTAGDPETSTSSPTSS